MAAFDAFRHPAPGDGVVPPGQRRAPDRTDHRRFAFLAGDVAGMENAPRAVPAFAGEIPYALAGLVEFHSAIDQIVNTLGGMFADTVNDRTVAEPCAGNLVSELCLRNSLLSLGTA